MRLFALPASRTTLLTAEVEHRLSGPGSILWFVYVDGDYQLTEGFTKTVEEAQQHIRERWGVEPRLTVRKAYVKKPKRVRP